MKLIPKFQQGNIIQTRDINGNLVYMDLNTGRVTSVNPEQNQGTIQQTVAQSVGSRIKSRQKADQETSRQVQEGEKRRGAKRIKVKGKEVTVEPVTTQLTQGPDRESPNYGFYQNYWKRKSDKEMWDQKENETLQTLAAFAQRFFPSHYIGAINEGKTPFIEDNNETGSFVGNLAADIILPTWIAKGTKYLGNAGKLFRTSSKPTYVRPEIRVSEPWNPTNGEYVRPQTIRGISESSNNPLLIRGNNPREYLMSSNIEVPEGWSFTKELDLRTRDGIRHVHQIRNNETGKFAILEDFDKFLIQPKIDLKKYRQQKLTGKEEGFDEWALSLTPENDHFPDLSHGLNDSQELIQIMNREFEGLPNGSRVDLGETFSGDSSSNLLQYVYRNNNRIKMILPKNANETVRTNSYGVRGEESARIFNQQLERLLDHYGYSPNAVQMAKFDSSTNTLIVPKLSFIKLFRLGRKINGINVR